MEGPGGRGFMQSAILLPLHPITQRIATFLLPFSITQLFPSLPSIQASIAQVPPLTKWLFDANLTP